MPRRTDGQTSDRFTDPAPHTMPAASTMPKKCSFSHRRSGVTIIYFVNLIIILFMSTTHLQTYLRQLPRSSVTHTRLTALFSGTTQVSRYQKGKTNLDFTEARDSEWQWHQLGHMQVCTSLQTDNHASTPPLSFLQAGCPSCRPTNSINALKANTQFCHDNIIHNLQSIGTQNANAN